MSNDNFFDADPGGIGARPRPPLKCKNDKKRKVSFGLKSPEEIKKTDESRVPQKSGTPFSKRLNPSLLLAIALCNPNDCPCINRECSHEPTTVQS